MWRGQLPHHRGALRPEPLQTVHDKGESQRCLLLGGEARRLKVSVCGLQVEKATMTDGLFPEPLRVRHKERGGRWGHASPFLRGSTIVRSQTFSPGARSQYVCRVSCEPNNLMVFWLRCLFLDFPNDGDLAATWFHAYSCVSYTLLDETFFKNEQMW